MRPFIRCAAALACAIFARTAESQQREEPVLLQTANGALHGTLLLPARLPAPVALIIAGSGPTDRNGNSPALPGQNNSLKYLAEGLAQQGIASLRYDKRGIAESVSAGPSEAQLRFGMYVDDAEGWLAQLRRDKRFTTLAVIGHSEGALIGTMAAAQGRADAFVSVAGAGRAAGIVLREQLKAGLPDTAMFNRAAAILSALEAGRGVDTVPPTMAALFRTSVQPYLMSWLPLDPAALLAALTIPVLIIQGTTDIQVSVADAEALLRPRPTS